MGDGINDSIQTGYSPGEETYVDKRKLYEDQNEIDPDDIPSNKYKPVKTYDDIMKTMEDFATGRGGPWEPITEPTKLLITQLMGTLTFTHKQHTELLKEKATRPRPKSDKIDRERITEFLSKHGSLRNGSPSSDYIDALNMAFSIISALNQGYHIEPCIVDIIEKEIESCNSAIESARPGSDESELPSVKKDTLEWVLRLFRLFIKQSKPDILQQPVSQFVEEVTRIINESLQLFRDKNDDYGNSFQRTYDKIGWDSAFTFLSTKFNRIESISGKDKQCKVKTESIIDTLIDLGMYCFMTIACINLQNKEEEMDAVQELASREEPDEQTRSLLNERTISSGTRRSLWLKRKL